MDEYIAEYKENSTPLPATWGNNRLGFNIYGEPYYVAYFVTTTGNAGNTGLSEGSAWTLTKAFATAIAGDIVRVKAGDYGNLQLDTSFAGTSGNPIQFIGYKTTPGDVDSGTSGPTETWAEYLAQGRDLDHTEMPLLEGVRTNGRAANNSRGIEITHNYIHIENFQLRWYEYGIYTNADHGVFKNVIGTDMGDFDPSHSYSTTGSLGQDYEGNSIWIASGDNNLIENCLAANNGARGYIIVSGKFNTIRKSEVWCDNEQNPVDYYFIIINAAAQNNTIEFCHGERVGNLYHRGHGFNLKCGANNNTIRESDLVNTSIELNIDANNNTLDKVHVQGGTYGGFAGGIKLDSNSWGNTFKNCSNFNGEGLIFLDSNESGCTQSAPFAGKDNNFINLVIANAASDNLSAIAYHWNSQSGSLGNSPVQGNKFYRCTFDGSQYLFTIDRPGNTNEFIECSFSNFSKGLRRSRYSVNTSDAIGASYVDCNWWNVNFTIPTGTNNKTANPLYTDAAGDDYSLQAGSGLIDQGSSSLHLYDFNDNARTGTPDIGAYEFGGSPPEDVDPPGIITQNTFNIREESFDIEGTFDEPVTAYAEYRKVEEFPGAWLSTITGSGYATYHILRIGTTNGNPDLEPNTTYEYRWKLEDQATNTFTSTEYQETTLGNSTNPPPDSDVEDVRDRLLKWFRF